MKKDEEKRTPEPFSEDGGEEEKRTEKTVKKTRPSVKIAYAAVSTAIAIVMSVISVFLPVRITPLVLASFCFYVCYIKCGVPYGIISAAATWLIAFFCGGLSTSLLLIALLFFPYSLLAYFLRRFSYRKVKGALIRAASVMALSVALGIGVYFIACFVALGGMDILAVVGNLGYAPAIIAVAAVAVIVDFLFTVADAVIVPKLK